VSNSSGNIRYIDAEITDADGRTVAVTQGSAWGIIDRPDRRRVEPQRVLATLVFTDIVGSTNRAQALGDDAWRTLLGEHNALVRRELTAHRGREIKAMGDGFLLQFESPAAAVRFARSTRDGVRHLNLDVRASVHTGECEVQGADLAGITVHVASRIMDEAAPGEILVSQVVKDLSSGSGLRFADRGTHALKGVEGEWQLYAVDRAP
jgi:class 3 adenylate cyclase